LSVPELGKVSEETAALWLLSLICSYHARSKYTVMELGGVDAVSDRLASCTANRQVCVSQLNILFSCNLCFNCNNLNCCWLRSFLLTTDVVLRGT